MIYVWFQPRKPEEGRWAHFIMVFDIFFSVDIHSGNPLKSNSVCLFIHPCWNLAKVSVCVLQNNKMLWQEACWSLQSLSITWRRNYLCLVWWLWEVKGLDGGSLLLLLLCYSCCKACLWFWWCLYVPNEDVSLCSCGSFVQSCSDICWWSCFIHQQTVKTEKLINKRRGPLC